MKCHDDFLLRREDDWPLQGASWPYHIYLCHGEDENGAGGSLVGPGESIGSSHIFFDYICIWVDDERCNIWDLRSLACCVNFPQELVVVCL